MNAPEPSQQMENGAGELDDQYVQQLMPQITQFFFSPSYRANMFPNRGESPEEPSHAQLPHNQPSRGMVPQGVGAPQGYMTQADHQAYQNYLQAQQQAQRQYAMPPGVAHMAQNHPNQPS